MSRGAAKVLLVATVWGILFFIGSPVEVRAHCDTLNGPVVQDAQRALQSGDLTPVLKWIAPKDEPAIRDAFTRTTVVRKQSEQARELADRYFFETVVRIHRAGEGAPYDGLKPADSVSPAVVAADQALASASSEKLVRELSGSVADEVRRRFQIALQRKVHAEDNPEAGRAFVSAYVDYVHFVEELHAFVGGAADAREPIGPRHEH